MDEGVGATIPAATALKTKARTATAPETTTAPTARAHESLSCEVKTPQNPTA